MKNKAWILVIALLVVGGQIVPQSMAAAPSVDIWTAAATGNLDAIKQHVAAGTDLNAKEPSGGSTPLMIAALVGQTEAAKLLIEKGANINARSNDGGTALHAAAFFCRTRTVKLLLSKGADVNVKNVRGETALDTVAGEWSQAVEEVYSYVGGLLQIQLDIERIKAARPNIADILRERTSKTDDDIWSAAKSGNIEAVMKHISAGNDINIRSVSGATPLIAASTGGQTEIIRLLIEKGADVNLREDVGGSTALLAAAFFGHTEIVEMLIDKGADVNARNLSSETPLDTVSAPWSPELAEIYKFIAGLLQIELDLKKVEFERP